MRGEKDFLQYKGGDWSVFFRDTWKLCRLSNIKKKNGEIYETRVLFYVYTYIATVKM